MGSNRTFMELKFARMQGCVVSHSCSNRTFMELKFEKGLSPDEEDTCSNRTFMELKFVLKSSEVQTYCVLIVPLWN